MDEYLNVASGFTYTHKLIHFDVDTKIPQYVPSVTAVPLEVLYYKGAWRSV